MSRMLEATVGRKQPPNERETCARRRELAFSYSRKGWRRQSGWRHLRAKRLTRSRENPLVRCYLLLSVITISHDFFSAAYFSLPLNLAISRVPCVQTVRKIRGLGRGTRAKARISLLDLLHRRAPTCHLRESS